MAPSSSSTRTPRSTRADTTRTRCCPRILANATSSARRWMARSIIPGLYNGRNKTFFMGAYEGVRGEATTSPFGSVPTAAMRRGDFSEITTPIRNPFTGQPFAGNIIPELDDLADLARAPAVLPCGEPGWHRQQSAGAERQHRQRGPGPRQGRSESRQQDSAERPLQLARQLQREHWQRGHSRDGDHAAARQQELAVFLHAHAAAEPAQRLPDRLSPHRLRYRESLLCQRTGGRRNRAGHPRVQRRHGVQQSRPPQHQRQQLQRARDGRGELVPVRHDVPDVERARLQPRIAQHPLRLRPEADGDRPARGERPARALQLHWRHQRLLGRRLHARAAAHGDPADGSDPGSRRRLAQRVLRQRYLAGVAKPDA